MLKCIITLFCLAFVLQCAFTQSEYGSDCQTPDKNYGSCVNLMQCQSLVKLITKRRKTSEEETFLKSSWCGYDKVLKDPKVCCPFQTTCGRNFYSTSDRIVGGRKSALGDWPWMAALGIRNKKNEVQWVCGGALISDSFVLTAGHCTHNVKLILVRLGDLNLNPLVEDGANPIDVPISRIIRHERYNPSNVVNDIALLKLEKRVTFNELIQPICLPIPPSIRNSSLVKMEPTVTGWGAVKWKGASSDDLLEVTVAIYDENKCKEIITSYSKQSVIDNRVLCAGDPYSRKIDSCQGDSGGPLMWPKFGRYYLVGIVSYGFECAKPGVPGVYTRVSSFIDWIAEQMNKY